jgi:glycosyltransferase involved in cell wall biosynthesis
MKGLLYYRTHLDDMQNAGIVRKCQHFAVALEAHGFEIDTVFFSQKGLVNSEGVKMNPHANQHFTKGSLRHIYLYYFLSDNFLISQTNWLDYNFVIIRHLPLHPNFIRLLKFLKSKHPHLKIILDFPTFPYEAELKQDFKGRILAFVDAFYHEKLIKYVDFALYNGDIQAIFGLPVVKVANGIGVEGLTKNCTSPPLDNCLKVVFAGNISEWHGIDRALIGLKNNNGHHIHLTIIGDGTALPNLKEMVKNLNIEASVAFVPPQNRADLQPFYEKAQLGLGSLALHRIGLTEATPLKHREYCAVGLPFIYTGKDDDFSDKFEFALQLSADESPLDWGAIVAFYQKLVATKANISTQMRQYAKDNLTWKRKVEGLVKVLSTSSNVPTNY